MIYRNNMDTTKQTHVHIVFKSHLDIGFTDLAHQVVDQYLHSYIPAALELIEMLEEVPDVDFSWTTGSWLIQRFYASATTSWRSRLEKAIAAHKIHWHALPFTMHSELATVDLYKEGLEISKELDRRFDRHTIAAKCTDVPGHTKAIVPLLKAYGIEYLHIGINAACSPAEVPELFRWHADGKELIVNYQSGYGSITEFDPAHTVLYFSHQHDNERPPSIGELKKLYETIRLRYPDARIIASDLSRFAETILPFVGQLPVVKGEIGDTWIHGAASDPLKVARYRALARSIPQIRETGDPGERTFTRTLLLVPEHTWGMDQKRFLPDFVSWSKPAFQASRKRDLIPQDTLQEGVLSYTKIPLSFYDELKGRLSYRLFERSWKEQRDYLEQAVAALQTDRARDIASKALRETEPKWPDNRGFTHSEEKRSFSSGKWQIEVDVATGALLRCYHGGSRLELASHGEPFCRYRYHVHDHREFSRFFTSYLLPDESHHEWSLPDYTKPGLSQVSDLRSLQFLPIRAAIWYREGEECFTLHVCTQMPEEAVETYGAPAEVALSYQFSHKTPSCLVTLHWRRKEASRIPESSWLEFHLPTGFQSLKLSKMGMQIDPAEVVRQGNRALHAIDDHLDITLRDRQGLLRVCSLDAPVVSLGRPRILEFDRMLPDLRQGIFFNLHNNLWGTNFPMWYDDDALFRFSFSLTEEQT
jgi:hypothetical protein